MRTRVLIGLVGAIFAAVAAFNRDLAALYVAVGTTAVVFLLHAIEYKLNRLLDAARVRVPDREIAAD